MRELLDTLVSATWSTFQPLRSRRAAERVTVLWNAQAAIGGAIHAIEVQNISTLGLMARIDLAVLPGAEIVVHLAEQGRLAGEVRWYREGRFGMCFDAPAVLNPAIVAKYRHAADEQAEKLARWMV